MHDDILRLDFRFCQSRLEPLYTLGLYRNFIAIVFRNGGKELHRGHIRIAGSLHGHVNAAVVDRVCAEEFCHS